MKSKKPRGRGRARRLPPKRTIWRLAERVARLAEVLGVPEGQVLRTLDDAVTKVAEEFKARTRPPSAGQKRPDEQRPRHRYEIRDIHVDQIRLVGAGPPVVAYQHPRPPKGRGRPRSLTEQNLATDLFDYPNASNAERAKRLRVDRRTIKRMKDRFAEATKWTETEAGQKKQRVFVELGPTGHRVLPTPQGEIPPAQ